MNKKRGFTLIELLAVIVVLAILALILVPIVTTTIKNAKKGSAEVSAQHYVKAVELAVSNSELNKNHIPDGTYTIDSEGNLTGTNLPNGKLEIEATGTKPNGGTIVIKDGQVTTESTMTVGDYDVKYDSASKEYVATEKGGSTTVICELSEGTKETVGATYTCHLDSDRTFYVLETSGDNVSLIMDRNFIDDAVGVVDWCIGDGFDNTTCKNITSKDEGTPLKHIQDIFGTNVEVSIPSASQIATASNVTFSGNSEVYGLSTWLYENLSYDSKLYGYWTSTPFTLATSDSWYVAEEGKLNVNCDGGGTYAGDLYDLNIRPVITVSKSQLG